jgi:DNA integrity scanning protein DisA with diadenylate cyclase activity
VTGIDTLTRSMRWQDIVDVLLLTVLFSALYRLMRRTVALQVALGLSALLLGSWVANRLGLILTAYLLTAVRAVAAIIGVVVFQREIRMALGRANPFRWLSRRSPPPPGTWWSTPPLPRTPTT